MLTASETLALSEKYRGKPVRCDPAFNFGYSGSLVRRSFYGLAPADHSCDAELVLGPLPPTEDLIEWTELCCAIDKANREFTMVELGAGFGRWVVMGGVAARRAGLRVQLIAVEAEREHFAMMREHFVDNEFDPTKHVMLEAAVTDAMKEVIFVQGHSKEWWGQAILPSKDYGYGDWPQSEVVQVRGVPLSMVIESVSHVDFIDMDVQGAEAEVVRGSLDAISEKVSRFHIGTHNHDVEGELRLLFSKIGFRCVNDYPCNSVSDTKFGTIHFDDGIQTWVNPRL